MTLLLSSLLGTSQTLFTYDFAEAGSSTPATPGTGGGTSNNLTFSAFSAHSGDSTNGAAGVWSFSNWPTGATSDSDVFSGAVDLGEYYEFTLTPITEFEFTLSSISFEAGRSGTGVRQFVVRSSVDNYGSNLTANATDEDVSIINTNIFQFKDENSTESYAGNSVTLTGGNFTRRTSPVTFRFYGFNAEGSSGTFRLDDVTISGEVLASAVPEPGSFAAIAGVAMLGFAASRRRRTGSFA